jgi:hypothetical protein
MPLDGCLHCGDESAGGFERVGNLFPGDVDKIAVVCVKSLRIKSVEAYCQLGREDALGHQVLVDRLDDATVFRESPVAADEDRRCGVKACVIRPIPSQPGAATHGSRVGICQAFSR